MHLSDRHPALTAVTAIGIAALAVTGCTAASRDTGRGAPDATLEVRVTVSGGPARSDGTSALVNSPMRGSQITVKDSAGHHWVRRTGAAGTVVLRLRPGRYSVTDTDCAIAARNAVLVAGHATQTRFHCVVP